MPWTNICDVGFRFKYFILKFSIPQAFGGSIKDGLGVGGFVNAGMGVIRRGCDCVSWVRRPVYRRQPQPPGDSHGQVTRVNETESRCPTLHESLRVVSSPPSTPVPVTDDADAWLGWDAFRLQNYGQIGMMTGVYRFHHPEGESERAAAPAAPGDRREDDHDQPDPSTTPRRHSDVLRHPYVHEAWLLVPKVWRHALFPPLDGWMLVGGGWGCMGGCTANDTHTDCRAVMGIS